ncbi:MAG: pantetheine-phosphate adenylyltransferase [Candidatus Omnitrophica bacterium]|nr:pantetheine-phosphate adenylyltransferase [Candidatus Omnitrophota bacterium]
MRRAICPGTFDPITNGHIDIIKRAAAVFDEVTVAIVKNPTKKVWFSYQERYDLVKEVLGGIGKVKVEGFDGLVVEYAKIKNVAVIVRGLRMISDFEYEFQMALTNRNLAPEIETVFLMPHPEYSFISSRLIKEAGQLNAKLHKFIPLAVVKALKTKIKQIEK